MKNKLMSFVNRFDLRRTYREREYKRFAKNAADHSIDCTTTILQGYFSQCGQDKWIAETVFPGMRNGVFVDVGAHDGVSFSNTAFLEKELGWTGLAVEPIPEVFEQLNRNRTCIKVNGCVSASNRMEKFLRISGYSEMLSGIVDCYDRRHLERISREVKAHGGGIEEISVSCYQLNALLEKFQLREVHYLSLDIEGGEYPVLKSFDFDAINVHVWGIENNYRDYRIPRLMKRMGYQMKAMVGDEFYVKENAQS